MTYYQFLSIFRIPHFPSFVEYFSRELLSAVLASAVSGYQLIIFMAYLGLHLTNLGAIPLIIGFVFFSRNFFQIFLRVPFGELAQIFGRKPLITAAVLFYSVAYFVMYLATFWVHVFIATVLVAIGMSLYWPSMFAYIGDISTNDYGKINGIIFMGSDVGVILGSLLSSYLLNQEIVDLSGLFLYGGVIGLGGVVLVYLTLSRVISPDDQQDFDNVLPVVMEKWVASVQSLARMMRIKPLNIIYLFQLVVSFAEYFVNSFFPLFVVLFIGLTNSNVADILFISTLAIFLFKPFLGSISDRFGFRIPVVGSLVINGIILFSFRFVDNFVIIVVLYSVVVSTSLTSYLAVNGGTSYAAPSKDRGLAMGALGFWVSFGRSSSSLILTPIWELLEMVSDNPGESIATLFQITGVIIIFAAFLLFIMSREVLTRRDTKQEAMTSLGSEY